MIAEAYVGLGSNLGDRGQNIRQGLRLVSQVSSYVVASSLYETTPVGFGSQPRFLNAACRVWTRLDPFELMARLRELELIVGRQRPFANAPRTLDLDMLLYARQVIDTTVLTLPHPRMAERAFVLTPLAELAPGLAHPVLKETVASLLGRLPTETGAVTKVGRL